MRRDPLDASAHHALGNALQDAGEIHRAIGAYQKALRLHPGSPSVLNDLGTAYHARGDYRAAERRFREAIALDPRHPSALENLGSTLRSQGRLTEARRALQRALWLRIAGFFRRRPPAFESTAKTNDPAQGHFIEALRLQAAGSTEAGIAACRQALAARPDHAEALHLLASLLSSVGRDAEALPLLRRAIELEPDIAPFHNTLGNLLRSLGERRAAVDAYERAVAANPDAPEAHCNIASVFLEVQDYETALPPARRSVELDPDFAQGYVNLGLALHGCGRYAEAESAFRRALLLDAGSVRCHSLLAQSLREQGRMEEAEEELERSLAAEPRDPMVLLTASAFYQECRGDSAKARGFIERVLELDPDDPRARFNSALVDFQEGLFSPDAWSRYETRKLRAERDLAYKKIPLPDWDGRPLPARALLLYGEQGIGDEIMFASMVPDVLREVPQPVLACDPRLAQLFARSFPGAIVVPWARVPLAESPSEMRAAAAACPLGSLGQFYRRSKEAFPGTAYLRPDEQKVAKWRGRLADLGPGPKIGLAWRGGTPNSGRGRRSLSLEALLSAIPGGERGLVALQRDVGEDEARALAAAGVAHWAEAIADPDEAAALVCALDVTVSVCSWIVHLAGALGRRVLVPTPLVPEWRYGIAGPRMIWYASAELHRQQRFGDWDPVLQAIRRELAPAVPRRKVVTEKATSSAPAPSAEAQLALAGRYHDEGKLDRAILHYRRALALDGSRAETYNDLGIAYFAKGFLDDAAKNFREAIARRPSHHVAHANLGAVLRRQGKLREARQAYQAALMLRVRAWLRRLRGA